jgi:hypothetical protein
MKENRTYEQQMEFMKDSISTLHDELVSIFADALVKFYQIMLDFGIEPEIIMTAINSYWDILPEEQKKITLEVRVKDFPTTGAMN